MAFTDLDAQLRNLQADVVNRSNEGLLFGGTTQSEFDFLSRAAADNTGAPNFYSFMAGVSASNLAEQQSRQQAFDRAQVMRETDSQLALRGAQSRNFDVRSDLAEAELPFVADRQQADINRTRASIRASDAQVRASDAQTDLRQAELPFVDDRERERILNSESERYYRDSRRASEFADLKYSDRRNEADLAYKEAQADYYQRRPTSRSGGYNGPVFNPNGFSPAQAPAPVTNPAAPVSPMDPKVPATPTAPAPRQRPYDAAMGALTPEEQAILEGWKEKIRTQGRNVQMTAQELAAYAKFMQSQPGLN